MRTLHGSFDAAATARIGRKIMAGHAMPRQRGVALLVTLLMLVVVLLLGASAAQLALQGEKAARGERDRHVAFQAAEDALADAENDIGVGAVAAVTPEGDAAGPATGAGSLRRAMFGAGAGPVFAASCGGAPGSGSGPGSGSVPGSGPAPGPAPDPGSGAGAAGSVAVLPVLPALGLAARAEAGHAPAWQSVDLGGDEDGGACSVAYGAFTGAEMQTGQGFLPFRRPRYVIERLACHLPGDDASVGAVASPHACYRVTAIGFGAQPSAEVVLQTVVRKAD